MSRSGYSDDLDQWRLIMYRGQVASAIRGARGQAFLRELLAALDAMPEKKLIAHEWVTPNGEVCALGCLAVAKGIDASTVDAEEPDEVASAFNIASQLAAEVAFQNDEGAYYMETPDHRWMRMREWVASQIRRVGTEETQ